MYAEGLIRTWRFEYATLVTGLTQYNSHAAASSLARAAVTAQFLRCVAAEATQNGPYEQMHVDALADGCRRSGCVCEHTRESWWDLIPPRRASDDDALIRACRNVRYLTRAAILTQQEIALCVDAVSAVDPVLGRYSGRSWDWAPALSVRPFLRRIASVLDDPDDPHDLEWTTACTYADGERHRAAGWSGGTRVAREANDGRRAAEVHDPDLPDETWPAFCPDRLRSDRGSTSGAGPD